MKNKVVAFIPARSGSKRAPNKNIRKLAGHPLMAYAIRSAIDSNIFTRVVVSTESEKYMHIAKVYGAEVLARPAEYAVDTSPDIEWVTHALTMIQPQDYHWFAILRPTNPFRRAYTIKRAWGKLDEEPYESVDSMRAVERAKHHPGKMWEIYGNRMVPFIRRYIKQTPWHSQPTQNLPVVWVQNASLEICKVSNVYDKGTTSGDIIMPFYTEGHEGFDINDEYDWDMAERLVREGAKLPEIN